MRRTKTASMAVLTVLEFASLSGCSLLGAGTLSPEETHEMQRLTAINFRRDWPATESIRFTQEGNVSGAGTWAVNAVVTIGGRDYREIVGLYEGGGEPLPQRDAHAPTASMLIHFSDGTSEVLK